eukprot:TRINITY_DN26651_c0_g1_i1.p1 TRINITY_DN26651_c0_g1~~TRINITY_DN26651_c0_g1_i1.p1  ORF type:complete len:824 (-),score=207.93 TRINITY_DN26651_c0_g1_i1:87-2558(-)
MKACQGQDGALGEHECKRLFTEVDKNNNRRISIEEFMDYLFKEPASSVRADSSGRPKTLPEEALTKAVGDELKTMISMPPQILSLLELVMILVAGAAYAGIDSVKRFLGSRTWLSDLKEVRGQLEAGNIPAERIQMARQLQEAMLKDYGDERVSKSSRAAGLLWTWAKSILAQAESCAGQQSSFVDDSGKSFLGDDFSAPSVHHLEGKLLAIMRTAGFNRDAKVYEIEAKVIRAQGEKVVCPRDGKLGAAYIDSIGTRSEDVGLAEFMLSYSWGYQVGDIVDTLTSFCSSRGNQLEGCYVWMCCLCVNQHRVKEKEAAGEKVPFDTFQKLFHQRVKGTGHIIAMMAPWYDPLYIRRVWCAFELYTATALKNATVTVAMPPEEQQGFIKGLRQGSGISDLWRVLGDLDIASAEASVPDDKENILGLIEKSPGFQQFNYLVARHLQGWIVSTSEMYLKREFEVNKGESPQEAKDLVSFVMSVSELCQKLGDAQKAISWLERCLKFVEDGGHPETWAAVILRNLSTLKYDLGLKVESSALLERATSCQKTDVTDSMSLFSRADAQLKCGQLAEALIDFEQAAVLNGGKNLEELGTIFINIGSVKGQLGDFDGCEAAFKKVVEIEQARGNAQTPIVAQAFLNLGNSMAMKSQYDLAHEYFDKSMDIHMRLGTLAGSHGAKLVMNMAVTLWNAKDVEGAAEKGKQAMKMLEACGMQQSDAYMKAQQLAQKLSEQQEGTREMDELHQSLQKTIKDLEVLLLEDAISDELKTTMTGWQEQLQRASSQVMEAAQQPGVQLSGLDGLAAFVSGVQGNIRNLQQKLEAMRVSA